MAANDLSKPLGQKKSTGSSLSRMFMFGSFGLLATVIAGLSAWVVLADNPDGGLPTSEVDLSATIDTNSPGWRCRHPTDHQAGHSRNKPVQYRRHHLRSARRGHASQSKRR